MRGLGLVGWPETEEELSKLCLLPARLMVGRRREWIGAVDVVSVIAGQGLEQLKGLFGTLAAAFSAASLVPTCTNASGT